jgi:hypothetical protein
MTINMPREAVQYPLYFHIAHRPPAQLWQDSLVAIDLLVESGNRAVDARLCVIKVELVRCAPPLQSCNTPNVQRVDIPTTFHNFVEVAFADCPAMLTLRRWGYKWNFGKSNCYHG